MVGRHRGCTAAVDHQIEGMEGFAVSAAAAEVARAGCLWVWNPGSTLAPPCRLILQFTLNLQRVSRCQTTIPTDYVCLRGLRGLSSEADWECGGVLERLGLCDTDHEMS